VKIPYARPTQTGPSVEEQMERLRAAGGEGHFWCDEKPKEWTERDFAVRACREGDELLVCSLWLLGKNRADLDEAIKGAVRRGAVVRVLDGGTIVSVEGLAVLAEMTLAEAAWRQEQVAPARKRRKAKKAEGGRPPALSNEEIEEAMTWQKDEDLTLSQIAARFDERGKKVSRTAVYESIQRYIARKGATS